MEQHRGRDASLSPTRGFDQQRSLSRGRRANRSTSRAPATSISQTRLTEEEKNYRWSILTYDPQERFVRKTDQPVGTPSADDDVSDEEQLFDDETTKSDLPKNDPLDYDIMEIELPNYRASINTYYKKQLKLNDVNELADALSSKAKLDLHSESVLRRGKDAQKLAEVLALGKALDDARDVNSMVPSDMQDVISKSLEALGVPNASNAKTSDLVSMENAKDKSLLQLKKLIIENSKKIDEAVYMIKKGIERSEMKVNNENLRASMTLTLGDFFSEQKEMGKVNCIIVYNDGSVESMITLQYVIGAMVKSGDVLYVIHTAGSEFNDLNYYKRQCERIASDCENYLSLVHDKGFKLHVVIESSYRKFLKHFLNQLVKYLDPMFFAISSNTLLTNKELKNYVTPCPFMVMKKKPKARS
ncbi:Sugar utilization regulatory protein IMP2 [Cyberlindnera fabianii]|uniref:Sugar utilization regulatory protein IMP2 n=1 Tax=Cyberlindnera fabianii TaxID=36022 RepID=A0A1V2LEQ6_CYBFA|nr:Sugar utilization regulatory protein IMP2 [Cyberlindnera fabianii]